MGGRYRLVEQLGSGGFGRVWRAHDEALGVEVAVKEILLPQRSGTAEHREQVARATREARNAARLRDHPHVVAVHDVIVEDGVPWIVMRLVRGRSLEEPLREEGALPSAMVARVASALLEALRAAEAAGIVHRDLKPANVMLAENGQVLLADFGISVHEADTRLTATGGVIGSVEYMAPERLNGAGEHISADLFSLGATLYRAVEGVSPFHRETATATMAAVVLHDPPPPRRAAPALAALITSLLAKRPEDRPTIDGLAALLDTIVPTIAVPPLSGPPAPHTPTLRAPAVQASRSVRAGRLAVAACLFTLGIGGIAFGCYMYITEGGWAGAYLIGTVGAALSALCLGLAAMFQRWRDRAGPPVRVVLATFLSVFLPVAAGFAVWNTVLLA